VWEQACQPAHPSWLLELFADIQTIELVIRVCSGEQNPRPQNSLGMNADEVFDDNIAIKSNQAKQVLDP
jgi:hypothetical protein